MDEQRFWAKVDSSAGPEECWPWTGYVGPNGYGYCNPYRSSPQVAHRVSYALNVGSVPSGHEVHHVCGNRSCVNPAHLQAVTHREHIRIDGRDRSRAKLTQRQVEQVRSLVAAGQTCVDVSRQFDVNPTTIQRIARRETWR